MKWKTFSLTLLLTVCSCGSKNMDTAGLAACVGDYALTLDEVRQNIPSGLSQTDSIRLATAYVNNWVEEQVVSNEASRIIPDMEDIDRMVDSYRRQLITLRYRQLMESEDFIKKPDRQQIEDYYINHPENFKASRPLVKGIYIKIAEKADGIKEIKRLYRSLEAEDLDSLEKLTPVALAYEYFHDRWIDWGQIETKIPLTEFDDNPDNFPLKNDHLELLSDGYWYLLTISDKVVPGELLPLEYAENLISEVLERENAIVADKELRRELVEKALESGTARIFVYE